MTSDRGCPIFFSMDLKPYQICRSNDGWLPVRILSTTDPENAYRVYVNPWGQEHENICECRGYTYTGHCKHQGMAADSVCGWSEIDCLEQQTEFEKSHKKCPRCGGPTKVEVDID